ncbi:MAG: polysaccharide biosynthesis tyrosine autokinase [Candidatus Thiocaldithrix dubininis]|uniref:non-specific protein-tyrosine kinase n=1 Tax=Candidatus Thiocaldithrix dubininis TaxID=3080823 RepID=A0AA95H973_9GAMM|nr:MAG: polysaccharide biosynthesis tyrosine autokinase [Candidatus Thiocaldithrix dubininis]
MNESLVDPKQSGKFLKPTDEIVLANFDEDQSQDDEIDLRHLLSVLNHYKWWILIVFAIALMSSLIFTALQTPLYQAQLTLEIDDDKPMSFSLGGGLLDAAGNNKDFYQTQFEILKSRTLADKVIADLNLSNTEALKQQAASSGRLNAILVAIRSWFGIQNDNVNPPSQTLPFADTILKNFSVTPVKNSAIVTLTYVDKDPKQAQAIVNAYAKNYIDINLERRKNSSAASDSFLKRELADAKSKVEVSEQKLIGFAKRESIVQLSADNKNADSLESQTVISLNIALAEAEKDRIAANARLEQAQHMSASKLLEDPTIQQLKNQLAKLQGDYQEKLQIYKPEYPLMLQLQSQIDELNLQIRTTSGSVSHTVAKALKAEADAAKQRESELRNKLAKQQSNLLAYRDKSIDYNLLQREVETNRKIYEALLERSKEFEITSGLGKNNVSIVDPALLPNKPFKPNPPLNLALGGVLGLFLGILTAFLFEFVNDKIRSSDELEKLTNLPILGSIPRMRGNGLEADIKRAMISHIDPTSAVAEAFRSMTTMLMFATRTGLPHTLSITSALPAEAKSSICVNLATALGMLGKRVLLIDADLRKPTGHQRLKLDNSVGLSSYLTYQVELEEAIQATSLKNVQMLTAGPISPNPVELLASERLDTLLGLAPEAFDVIIFDSPPTIGLSDAFILSNRVNATILVAAYGQARKRILLDTLKRLRRANANLIGVIFTKVKGKDGHGYGYGYGYGYYAHERKPKTLKDLANI